jgi:hypothetical protein
MAWNLRTWLFGETITAGKLNEIRDALNACGPGVVSAAGQIPVGTDANTLAGLTAPTASLLSLVSDLNEDGKMKWGSAFAGAAVQRTADETPSGPSLTMSFTDELFDTDGFVDLNSNDERIIIPTGFDGIYFVGGYVDFDNNDSTSDWDRGFAIAPNIGSGSAIVFDTMARSTVQSIHGGASGYDYESDKLTVSGLMGLSAGNFLYHYSWAGNTGITPRNGAMWAIRLMAIPS